MDLITLNHELKNLSKFCDIVLKKIESDSIDIDKHDEEIYDNNGEFLEIINPLYEELYAQQQLLIRCVYYELNSIREFQLRNIVLYYYSDESFENWKSNNIDELINKHQSLIDTLAENNFNYDSSDVKNYWMIIKDNVNCNDVAELMLIYGDVSNIPKNIRKKFEKNINNKMKKQSKSFFNKFPVKKLPHWEDMEKLRKITNTLKHNKGFKSIAKDNVESFGERYNLTVESAHKMITSTSKFFHELNNCISKFSK